MPPILLVLCCQAVGLAVVLLVSRTLGPAAAGSALVRALAVGACAAALGRMIGLDSWWMAIQLVFAPAVWLATSTRLPSWIWLAAFLALAAIYWSTFRTQVPLYLSSSKVRQALIPLLPAGQFTFMDVGSGLGGVLIDLAAARPDGEFHGIESAPVPWLISRIAAATRGRGRCHPHYGSLWNADLSRYDVVFAYLSPVPMDALWAKVQREMRPGTLFISNTFAVRAAGQPGRVVRVDDLHQSTLHLWIHA
jgi:precorrin-6B methylase 2